MQLYHIKIKKMTLFSKLVNAKNILITTDLESDDCIFIDIFMKVIGKKYQKIYFLVGQGNSYMKYCRMKKYIELHKYENCEVIQGYSSKKDFILDGQDVFSEEECNQIRKVTGKEYDPDKYDYDSDKYDSDKLIEVLKTLPVIISLEPIRELIELYTTCKDYFKYIDFVGYMGFNVRDVLDKYKFEYVTDFLKSFRSVIFYETFHATGENSSLNNNEFPFDKLPVNINKLITQWNTHLYNKAQKEVEKINKIPETKRSDRDKAKLYRNKKIIKANDDANMLQFVNADTGLLASLLLDLKENEDYYQADVTFDGNYTLVKENKESKIIVICPKDKEEFRQKQIAFYRDFYA